MHWNEQAIALTGADLAAPNAQLTSKLRAIAKKACKCTCVNTRLPNDAHRTKSGASDGQVAPDVDVHPLHTQDIDDMLADEGMAPQSGTDHADNGFGGHAEDSHVQKKVKVSLQPPPKASTGYIPKEAVHEVRRLLSTFDKVCAAAGVYPSETFVLTSGFGNLEIVVFLATVAGFCRYPVSGAG